MEISGGSDATVVAEIMPVKESRHQLDTSLTTS